MTTWRPAANRRPSPPGSMSARRSKSQHSTAFGQCHRGQQHNMPRRSISRVLHALAQSPTDRSLRLPGYVFASSHSTETARFKFEDRWLEGFNFSLPGSRDKDVSGHAETTTHPQSLQQRRLRIDGTDPHRPNTREQVEIHLVEVTRKEDGILDVALPRSGRAAFPIFRVPELAGVKSHIGTRGGNLVEVKLRVHGSRERGARGSERKPGATSAAMAGSTASCRSPGEGRGP